MSTTRTLLEEKEEYVQETSGVVCAELVFNLSALFLCAIFVLHSLWDAFFVSLRCWYGVFRIRVLRPGISRVSMRVCLL